MGLMDKQTQQAFALGGLNDEGGEIDEASGNRVPIGGTKEGVRDDIEINISEGEFVFPADVVRYHGLDKMMALRQEAKMGLKQMERMGQMGNSDEATMPDDLPFEMADLIVVGGKGEPMKFANGGFVPEEQSQYTPKFETLEIADVPMMGGNTSTGTQTPLVYEDFIKLPKVTMQEYRDANGNSIIITFVNGVATTEIPEGYTLYTPPANTAPTTTQAAIQTVNINSYRPSDDSEGPEPQPDQPAPDYRNMNDNEFFSYMAEQNSFGAKAGNAAGLAIASMIGGPVGLLVGALMRNDKNNQMANMKSRIDRMANGPAKTNALALYKEYGGETDPKKKQGLFANIANFVTGLVTPVANALGINQEDAAKVAQNAAVTEVSGAVIGDGRTSPLDGRTPPAQSVIPTTVQTEGMGSPLSPIAAPATAATTSPSLNTMDVLGEPAGNIQTPTPTKDKSLTSKKPVPLTSPLRAGPPQAAPLPDEFSASATGPQPSNILPLYRGEELRRPDVRPERTGPDFDAPEFNKNLIGYDEVGVNKQPPSYAFIPKSEPVINPVSTQKATDRQDALTDAGLTANEVLARPDEPFLDAAARYARQGFDTFIAGDKNRGYFNPVNEQIDTAVANAQDTIVSAAVPSQTKPYDFSDSPSGGYDEVGVQMQDPRDIYSRGDAPTNIQNTGVTYGAPATKNQFETRSVDYPTQSFGSMGTYDGLTIPQSTRTAGEFLGNQTQQAFGDTSYIDPATPDYFRDEMEGFEKGDVTGFLETPAQARAREAAAQRARIQTRNKEIAAATALIPDRIKNSSYYNDQVKSGYTGSTTGGYAVGKISGSDGNESGVVQKADGKVTKLRDLEGYEGLKGTQRGAMTVFSDAKGTKFVKSTFGKKTKLNGDRYEGPGITQKDKGLGNTFFQSAANVITPGDGKSYVDGELVSDSGGSGSSSSSSSTKTYSSLAEAAKDGKHGQAVNIAGKGVQKVSFGDASYDAKMKAESDKADDGGSDDSKIVCTEMYRQTQLVDWQHTMKIWHVYQEKYLTPYHQIGYHWLFKPYVKGMKKSSMLTKLGATLAKHRTEHLRYVLTKGKSKDNLIGNVWCKFVHPLVYVAGIFKQKIGK